MSDRTDIVGASKAATAIDVVEGRAIAPSPTGAMLPIGKPVFLNFASGGKGGGLMSVRGTLVAFNDQWFCLRSEDGHTRLIAASSVEMLTTNPAEMRRPTEYVFGTEEEIRNGTARPLRGRR